MQLSLLLTNPIVNREQLTSPDLLARRGVPDFILKTFIFYIIITVEQIVQQLQRI